jgi:hypothetical protein
MKPKDKNILLLVAFTALIGVAMAQAPHKNTVTIKLAELCSTHPNTPCKDIIKACKSSFEKSPTGECYYIDANGNG